MNTPVFVYTASGDGLAMHLVRGDGDPAERWQRTLCGRSTDGWEFFDETVSAGEATCRTCRSRVVPSRDATLSET